MGGLAVAFRDMTLDINDRFKCRIIGLTGDINLLMPKIQNKKDQIGDLL